MRKCGSLLHIHVHAFYTLYVVTLKNLAVRVSLSVLTKLECNNLYHHLVVHIAEQNITSAHEKIAECKKEIQRAKRIRKNRQGKNIFKKYFLRFRQLLYLQKSWC